MTLWFLRTQQDTESSEGPTDAFVVAACGVIEIIFVRETTLPRLLNRLDELSLWQIDKAHEVALVKLLVGTDVWKAEGCCVSVNSLVVAHSCEDGKHLESAKRCPKKNRHRNRRPCCCGSEQRDITQIAHWQCHECATFAKCVYTLALAWPADPFRTPYDRVCVERPEGVTVMHGSGVLGLIYDIYNVDDKSELDIMWNFLVDGLARKKYSVNEDTLDSIREFVQQTVSQLHAAGTQSIDFDLLCCASKKTQLKRRRSWGVYISQASLSPSPSPSL